MSLNKQAPSGAFFMYGGEGGLGSNPWFDKFAGSEFARPKGARLIRLDRIRTAEGWPEGRNPWMGGVTERRMDAPNNPDRLLKDTGLPSLRG